MNTRPSRSPGTDIPTASSTAVEGTAGEGVAIVTRSLSAAEQLRAAVLAGDFAAGARLREAELTQRLGVSRTPVRSALQVLATEGLLEYAPNRGFSVRRYESGEIIRAFEIRAALEGLSARFAAEQGLQQAERLAIEKMLAAGDRLLASGKLGERDRTAYGEVNWGFHDAVQSGAASRMLSEMLRLCSQVPMASPRTVVAFEHRSVRRRHDDHHRIYEAILARDGAKAETLMRAHVASVRTALIRQLDARAGVDARTP